MFSEALAFRRISIRELTTKLRSGGSGQRRPGDAQPAVMVVGDVNIPMVAEDSPGSRFFAIRSAEALFLLLIPALSGVASESISREEVASSSDLRRSPTAVARVQDGGGRRHRPWSGPMVIRQCCGTPGRCANVEATSNITIGWQPL